MQRTYSLKVSALAETSNNALTISFIIPKYLQEVFKYAPGQFITIYAGHNKQKMYRAYSICSAPNEKEIQISIKRVTNGKFSNWVHDNLKVGMCLQVIPPQGEFGLIEPDKIINNSYLGIAIGSGITPIISIIKTTLLSNPNGKFILIYGNKSYHSIMFREELMNLKNQYMDRFMHIPIFSQEEQEFAINAGRIDKNKLQKLTGIMPSFTLFDYIFVCGVQPMVSEITTFLEENGFDKGRIKTELFHAESNMCGSMVAPPIASKGETARQPILTVICDGVPNPIYQKDNSNTILNTILDSGIDVPYSCKTGVCFTCRCKVIQGEVSTWTQDTMNSVSCGTVLACQSFFIGSSVVLDFDNII